MKHLIVAIIAVSWFNLFAQKQTSPDLQIGLHYWAVDLVDPGVLLATDLALVSKQSGESMRMLMANFDIGYYYKYRSHHGLNFTPGMSFRFVKIPTGRFIDLKLGLGFQRSIYDSEVLEVPNPTSLVISDDTGQNLFMPYFMFRFGKDWRFTHQKPIGWNIGVGTYGRLLVNKRVVPGLFLTAGVNYYFKNVAKGYED
jgi:hypothetical protein